ncbi:MAG: PEP-CTERM sorting domain-containing protein [Rhodanobacter sp.]
MLKKKSISAALACVLAMGVWSGSALATPVNVGGVVIDSSSPINLTIDAVNFRETTISKVGDMLNGYGKLASINGTDQSVFCPGCDVGFTFQYTVRSIDTTGANPQVVFDMGNIKFYVDNTSSFSVLNPSSASAGTLWLALTGHAAPYSGFSDPGGELYSTVVGPVSQPGSQSGGFGLLDAAGGPGFSYFDTNTQADGADFSFSSSFLTKVAAGCGKTPSSDTNSICHYPISGTAELIASTPLPEPGAAGLLGLGLAFLGLFTWGRRKEAESNGLA